MAKTVSLFIQKSSINLANPIFIIIFCFCPYRLGITEIVLGVFSIIAQTIVLIWATEIFSCMWHDWLWFFDLEPVPSEAAGIWCGVMVS